MQLPRLYSLFRPTELWRELPPGTVKPLCGLALAGLRTPVVLLPRAHARVSSELLSHRDEGAGIAMLSLSFYDIWTWWVHAPIWISIPTLGALLFALLVAFGLFEMFFEN